MIDQIKAAVELELRELAKKFFPHLRQDYALLCIIAILENRLP